MANDAKGDHDMSNYLAASLIVILTTLPFLGQVKESGVGVIADKMEIPLYGVPLAAMNGVSAEVTLRLQMKKNGDVISVNVVSTHADCGFASGCGTDVRKGWGAGFVDAATQAAKISRFSCSKCEGSTFDHVINGLVSPATDYCLGTSSAGVGCCDDRITFPSLSRS